MRRRILRSALAASLLLALPHAHADCASLAGTTMRWIVPSKPGGGYDAYSRLLQPFVERELRAQIVIENRAEAGGIVAALAIRDAAPDGATIGILNASGLLTAHLIAAGPAPDPVGDFTVLARVISNHFVLFAGGGSGIRDMGELLRVAAERPVLAGVRDVGSASFVALPLAASILGLDYVVVTGYVGSTSRALAAIRGEVDMVAQTFDSASRFVEAGELIPLLQLTEPDADAYPSLAGVPALGGPDGLAVQRAAVTGRTPEQAQRQARALSSIIGAGRLLVGPPALPGPRADCLRTGLMRVLRSAGLRAAAEKAGLTVAPADAATALADLRLAQQDIQQFAPLVRAAVQRTRQ